MPYTKTTWVDQLDTGNKYTIMDNPDDTKAIEYAGEITRAGTPMNAENFNHMEQGIYDAHEAAAQLGEDKVDKVTGKGLSTNDYTTVEKTKLAGLSNYDDSNVNNNMVRAGTADANGQSQLYKTVNGVSTNIDPKCSLATSADTLKLNLASQSANINAPVLLGPYANPTTVTVSNVYKSSELTFNPSTNTLNVDNISGNAATASSATEANHAASADSAAKSETVKYYAATADTNRPLLLSYQAKDTTITDANRYNDVLFSNKFYANPSTGELSAVTFNGNLSGKAKSLNSARVYIGSSITTEGWQKVAEWTNNSITGYYNLAITLLVTGGRTYGAYGDNILKIFCYGNKSSNDVTGIFNSLSSILSTRTPGTVAEGGSVFIGASDFKMTYTKNGKDITYKLWLHRISAHSGGNDTYAFTILNAVDTERGTNFINDINLLSNGTFSAGDDGYTIDGEVAATDSVSCTLGTLGNATENSANTLKLNVASTTAVTNLPILCAPSASPTTALVQNVYKISEMTYQASTNTLNVDNVNGNAKTATKLSGAQTVLYESTTATTSFTLSGLFADWSAVMIYLTGAWVSGTSGTHGFFVPLKHLKDRGTGGITDFCGTKVINFLYVDDDSMRWFERQSQGAMTYSSVKVVGLY